MRVRRSKYSLLLLLSMESREGFCRRGRGRSLSAELPKTEKALEPKVKSLVRGIRRLGLSEAERHERMMSIEPH